MEQKGTYATNGSAVVLTITEVILNGSPVTSGLPMTVECECTGVVLVIETDAGGKAWRAIY